MKCTACHREILPVVAIDIDGTLGDYHNHFQAFAMAWTGRHGEPIAPYNGNEPHRDWFCREFETDVTTFRLIKLAYRQGGMKRMMPIFPGAVELVASLRDIAEVWLTTTRPWDRFDRVDPDTREWLRRQGIAYDGLLYSDDKMDELAKRVDRGRVCFVLDDQVDQLHAADETFDGPAGPTGITVLRLTDSNRFGPGWPVAVGSLLDARAMAVAHVQNWAVDHAFDDLPTTE